MHWLHSWLLKHTCADNTYLTLLNNSLNFMSSLEFAMDQIDRRKQHYKLPIYNQGHYSHFIHNGLRNVHVIKRLLWFRKAWCNHNNCILECFMTNHPRQNAFYDCAKIVSSWSYCVVLLKKYAWVPGEQQNYINQ